MMRELLFAVGGTLAIAAVMRGLQRWPGLSQALRRAGAWCVLQGIAVDAANAARRAHRPTVEKEAGVEREVTEAPQQQWVRGVNR